MNYYKLQSILKCTGLNNYKKTQIISTLKTSLVEQEVLPAVEDCKRNNMPTVGAYFNFQAVE